MTVFFNFQNVGNAMMMLTNAATGAPGSLPGSQHDCSPSRCAPAAWLAAAAVVSMLLMVRYLVVPPGTAGDNWEQYQLDTMVQPPDCDPAADDCGSPLASLYWVPFMIVCSFLLLSIVLAVVVDAYTLNQEPPQVSRREAAGRVFWSYCRLAGWLAVAG